MTSISATSAAFRSKTVLLSFGSLCIEGVAALYFLIDGVDDVLGKLATGLTFELVMECVVALALLLAVVVGARQLRASIDETDRQASALKVARGSLSELLALRFQQWNLTPSEADVALFAMKGCRIGEIARLRNAAEGTVRSQLSQVYAKAKVDSQAMLISQFIEELI